MSHLRPSFQLLLGLVFFTSCRGGDSARAPTGAAEPAATGGVVATVNGVAITDADLAARLGAGRHGGQPAGRPAAALESLIRDELAAQEAAKLRLPLDEKSRAEVARLEAQMNTVRRSALAETYYRSQVEARAQVSEADARKYFDDNKARIRTELHVKQILTRDPESLAKDLADIRGGAPFDDVAGRGLPREAVTGRPPWDLGFVRWNQIPDVWWPALDTLEPGAVSDIIKGPSGRYWIIQLVEKRQDPSIAFETLQAMLRERLRATRLAELRGQAAQTLRAKAKVVIVKDPASVVPPRAPVEEEP